MVGLPASGLKLLGHATNTASIEDGVPVEKAKCFENRVPFQTKGCGFLTYQRAERLFSQSGQVKGWNSPMRRGLTVDGSV